MREHRRSKARQSDAVAAAPDGRETGNEHPGQAVRGNRPTHGPPFSGKDGEPTSLELWTRPVKRPTGLFPLLKE